MIHEAGFHSVLFLAFIIRKASFFIVSHLRICRMNLIKSPAEIRYSNVTDDDEWLRNVIENRAA